MVTLLASCDYTTQNRITESEPEPEQISTLEQYLLNRLYQYPNWQDNRAQQNEFNKGFEKELVGKLKADKTFLSNYPFRFGSMGEKEINGKYAIHLWYSQSRRDSYGQDTYRHGIPIDGDVIVLIDKKDALSFNESEWERNKYCSFVGSFIKVGKSPNDYYKYFDHGMPYTDKFGLSDFGSSRTTVKLAIMVFKADSLFML